MSFRESAVEERRAVDGNNDNEGMIVHSGSESSTSYNTPSGFDPSDPEAITDLMTQPPMADPRSPTLRIRFNEQVIVTEHTPNTMLTHGGVASTSTGNLGGTGATSPSSSLPGSDALRQHANAGGIPNSNTGGSQNSNGSPNSNSSNGNNSNQGGTSNGNDPQGLRPNGNYLDKLVFTYTTAGGPLQHWGIEGTIRVADAVQFRGPSDPQNPHQLALHSKRLLMRPDIVDRVMDKMHFVYWHNDKNRVQAIINGMSLFVLMVPNARLTSRNVTMLEDYVASSQEMCHMLIRHLTYANTLPLDQLPLEVPLLFYAERMQTHPYVVTGSFNYVKKVADANAVVIPYGHDANGVPIVDPAVIQPPDVLPVSTTSPVPGNAPSNAPVSGPVQDPNAALVQGVLAAIQAMTQVHIQSDLRNASMTQQQARLQAATMRSNVQQLEHLTNYLGNLGHEVGKAIASHPTHHNHTIQATLSHPNAVPGQSNDPRDLGSLTRTIPVSMSIPTFDYGPYVQAFQPQPNDKNARRIDEATHQIVHRYLPTTVKIAMMLLTLLV